MVWKMTAIVCISLIISGCSLFTREIEIQTIHTEIEIAQPTMPRPMQLEEPYFYVVNEENLNSFLDEMKQQTGGRAVFVGITVSDYEVLATNMQEIKRYINELGATIVYYKTVTTPTED